LLFSIKKLLLTQGHPDAKRFCFQLNDTYKLVASKRAEVKEIIIRELPYNPNLQFVYRTRTELEPCLLEAREKITWAEHIVIIHPVWWGSLHSVSGWLISVISRFIYYGLVTCHKNE
jgi:putative NADPH-quinone reductase